MAYSLALAYIAPRARADIDADGSSRSAEAAPRFQPAFEEGRDTLDFRQLRHQTKNALQRLMCEIERHADTQTTAEGRQIFESLERRIFLSARLSDALFGFTSDPGTMEHRLNALADATIKLLGAEGDDIDCKIRVDGHCPGPFEQVVLRVAHEMIGNAIKHGLAGRAAGRITIRLATTAPHTVLRVLDDGPGPSPARGLDVGGRRAGGEGFSLMRELAAGLGGFVSFGREGARTAAELRIPRARPAGFVIARP